MKDNSLSYKIFTVFNILILIFIGFITLFPYLNVFALSLNDGIDSMNGGITLFPRKPTLENFRMVLSSNYMLQAVIISVSRVLLGTLTALLVQFAAAFALTRKSLPGRTWILIFFTIPMFFSGGLIPQYILFSKIHLINNFFVYILPSVFSFYNMIVIRTYINTIPISLEESAKLDGATEITILFRIIIPLSKPILATIALWVAVGHWNDWTTTVYFITQQRLYTMQYILVQFIKEGERIAAMIAQAQMDGVDIGNLKIDTTPEALKAAQVIITTLPIIAIYPFLQKYFIKGVMIGSVKE